MKKYAYLYIVTFSSVNKIPANFEGSPCTAHSSYVKFRKLKIKQHPNLETLCINVFNVRDKIEMRQRKD